MIIADLVQEYLGDWGNLFGHQKAAYSMLSEIYSAESIMETEVRRKMLSWYARFDLFAGLMSGYETVLGREWFLANEQYYLRQTELYPEDTDRRIELAIASHRLMAMDMALLFAKLPRGDISVQDFATENELLASRIASWKEGLDPLLADTRFLVTSIRGVSAQDVEDIANPYKPGTLYSGPLWSLNFLLLDGTALMLMRKYQTSLILQQPAPPDLRSLASDMCRIFEAIELWPGSYPGSLVAAQATLGIATLFLPKDERHTMWCRQKLAAIERKGYVASLLNP